MKRINKKGFTLVELLAVIVILGVLLLIAVPAVSNIIKSSKKKTFVSIAKLAAENVETLVSVGDYTGTCYLDMNTTDIPLERGSYGKIGGFVLVSSKTVTVYAYDDETKTLIQGKTLNDMSVSNFAPVAHATKLTVEKVRALNTIYFDTDGDPMTEGTPPAPKIAKCSF